MGGNMPCALNAFNEVAVQAFLSGKIGFTGISKLVEQYQNMVDFIKNPSIDDLFETDLLAREKANEIIKKINI